MPRPESSEYAIRTAFGKGRRSPVRGSFVAWAAVGCAAGALTALMVGDDPAQDNPAESLTAASFDVVEDIRELESAAPSERDGGGVFTERVALYAAASGTDDPKRLIAQIEAALERPLTPSAIAQLEALLGRLFELDADAAVATVRGAKLPAPLLSPVFRLWAEIDSAAAIGLLRELEAPKKRLLAVEIIEIVGADAIADIVAADPTLDADGLETAALIRRAERDPSGALRDIAGLPSFAQRVASGEIARVAAASDATTAIEAAGAVDHILLKAEYLEALHTELSLGGLSRWFAFLESLSPDAEPVQRGAAFASAVPTLYARAMENAAAMDAGRLLEIGRKLGGELGLAAEAAAMEVLAAEDPASSLGYLASLPEGSRRDRLAVSIATGYARRDVEAALNWVSQQPGERRVKYAVLAVLAETDLARAVRIDLDNPDTTAGRVVDAPNLPAWFGNRMTTDLNDPAGVADDIAARAPGKWWKERRLTAVLSQWAVDDPNAAITWMRAHRSDVPVDAVQAVAEVVIPQVGGVDADWLVAFGDMLDSRRRPEWLQTVVGRLAAVDTSLAMATADRYRSEPFYDSLLTSVVRTVARRAPEEAARLLGPSFPPTAVMGISGEWARLDPVAASAWAIALPDEQARSTAVRSVAQWWAEADTSAATAWARGLSDSSLRAEALDTLCRRSPGSDACE